MGETDEAEVPDESDRETFHAVPKTAQQSVMDQISAAPGRRRERR
jgi:hypothetical protein